jgi:isopentenyl phosphate kinase
MKKNLVFLKLGGSLITEKDKTATARPEVIARLAAEIAEARAADPGLRILLGHGSGSFGHVPAKQHNTRAGVSSEAGWRGFAEVWQQAAALNRIMMVAFAAAGLPAISFPPSATVFAKDGQVQDWNIGPIQAAFEANLLPVVFGDVVFDSHRGGTILSTEDLFDYLAKKLLPARILLAGDEDGIYADFAQHKELIAEINPSNYPEFAASIGGAAGTDVTGGMASKVKAMLALLQKLPQVEGRIFSGHHAGNVTRALAGESVGTVLRGSLD